MLVLKSASQLFLVFHNIIGESRKKAVKLYYKQRSRKNKAELDPLI